MDFKLHVRKGDTDFDTFRAETVKRLRELADQFEKSERKDPVMYLVHNDSEFFEKRQEAKLAKRLLERLHVKEAYPMFNPTEVVTTDVVLSDVTMGDINFLISLLKKKATEEE